MTGPYQRAVAHLAKTYEQDSPAYAGAFGLAIATFPAYLATEIAKDVMRQRQYNALPPIAERCEKFIKQAQPGTIFRNEYGRRSEIIGPDPAHKWNPDGPGRNGYKPPEYGPWYRVLVYWSDAEPSEDVMIWYTIGQPESVTNTQTKQGTAWDESMAHDGGPYRGK